MKTKIYNGEKRTWTEIDLSRLEHNFFEIKRSLPAGCRVAGVCKANAYGHGAVPVAHRLEKIGADYLAVSCCDEAAELRRAGISIPILILGPSPAHLAPEIARMSAEQAIGDIELARKMNRALADTGLTMKYHIKFDTGMGRIGFKTGTEQTREEVRQLLELENLKVSGVFTHFATADTEDRAYTEAQFTAFMEETSMLSERFADSLIIHCANSGAIVNHGNMSLDMVRPGISLYGIYPGEKCSNFDLRPVMSLKTRIYEIAEHKKGDTIGYGRTYTCPRDMRIAIIPVGYADGLRRCLSGKIELIVNGQRVKQIGRICMDVCMLDVSELDEVQPGDVVTVFGDEVNVSEHARLAGTCPNEILCGISPRVQRIYLA